MQNKSRAFTLIELLVVVLIIGILTAVALPQYQRAVEKARAMEAVSNLKALVTAEKVYKMANGKATEDLSQLDIQLLGSYDSSTKELTSQYFTYKGNPNSVEDGEGFEVIARRIHNENDLLKYSIYVAYNGTYYCVPKVESARWICEAISGKKTSGGLENAYYPLFTR